MVLEGCNLVWLMTKIMVNTGAGLEEITKIFEMKDNFFFATTPLDRAYWGNEMILLLARIKFGKTTGKRG